VSFTPGDLQHNSQVPFSLHCSTFVASFHLLLTATSATAGLPAAA
jgi:hypothetical protein